MTGASLCLRCSHVAVHAALITTDQHKNPLHARSLQSRKMTCVHVTPDLLETTEAQKEEKRCSTFSESSSQNQGGTEPLTKRKFKLADLEANTAACSSCRCADTRAELNARVGRRREQHVRLQTKFRGRYR